MNGNVQNNATFFNFVADAVGYLNEIKLVHPENGDAYVAVKAAILEGKPNKNGKSQSLWSRDGFSMLFLFNWRNLMKSQSLWSRDGFSIHKRIEYVPCADGYRRRPREESDQLESLLIELGMI